MLITNQGKGDLVFMTWKPDLTSSPDRDFIGQAYRELAQHMKAEGLSLLQERIFADVAKAQEILAARQAVIQDYPPTSGVPPTFIEGHPCQGSAISGVHAIAVRPSASANSETVAWQGQPCGRLVRGNDGFYLGLSDVAQLASGESLKPWEETSETFALLNRLLGELNWSINDVQRTWFYLDDILDWYEQFNQVRNAAFKEMGLGGDNGGVIPASTGIFGRNGHGRRCTLDLLATRPLDGNPFAVQRLSNPKQNEATEYGSAFSRGLVVAMKSCRYVYVSGTAAINDRGESLFEGDFERQTRQTVNTVKALLASAGAELSDICQATAFVKRREDVGTYQGLQESLGIAEMPALCMIGDVCRDELLYELDAVAVLPA